MATPELSVVCKQCGAEVSPYVTECPYCGTRLRRRAPKLEREGGEIRVREGRADRRRRRAAERAAARERRRQAASLYAVGDRPYATIAAILGPAVLLVVQRAGGLSQIDVGAIATPAFESWWRYLAAPWVYTDSGYLFAIGVAFALLVPGLERRVGAIPTALLLVACGSLGMLAAVGLDNSLGDGFAFAAGGNGAALGALGAWFAFRHREAGGNPDEYDWIAVSVAALVLLAVPLVDSSANAWAGPVGGVVGLAAGWSAARARVGGG